MTREVILNSLFSPLDRNGSKNKLEKLLKERKGTFPMLIKVGRQPFIPDKCPHFNFSL